MSVVLCIGKFSIGKLRRMGRFLLNIPDFFSFRSISETKAKIAENSKKSKRWQKNKKNGQIDAVEIHRIPSISNQFKFFLMFSFRHSSILTHSSDF